MNAIGICPNTIKYGDNDLPFLLFYSRNESTVSYYGANIFANDLQEAIFSLPELA